MLLRISFFNRKLQCICVKKLLNKLAISVLLCLINDYKESFISFLSDVFRSNTNCADAEHELFL